MRSAPSSAVSKNDFLSSDIVGAIRMTTLPRSMVFRFDISAVYIGVVELSPDQYVDTGRIDLTPIDSDKNDSSPVIINEDVLFRYSSSERTFFKKILHIRAAVSELSEHDWRNLERSPDTELYQCLLDIKKEVEETAISDEDSVSSVGRFFSTPERFYARLNAMLEHGYIVSMYHSHDPELRRAHPLLTVIARGLSSPLYDETTKSSPGTRRVLLIRMKGDLFEYVISPDPFDVALSRDTQ